MKKYGSGGALICNLGCSIFSPCEIIVNAEKCYFIHQNLLEIVVSIESEVCVLQPNSKEPRKIQSIFLYRICLSCIILIFFAFESTWNFSIKLRTIHNHYFYKCVIRYRSPSVRAPSSISTPFRMVSPLSAKITY